MERRKRLLQYSFAEIDMLNYFEKYQSERDIYLQHLTNKNPELAQIPDEIDIPAYLCDNVFRKRIGAVDTTSDFKTFDFFVWIVYKYSQNHMLTSRELEILNTFQKKFEIYHRVFSRYTPQIRKKGDEYKHLHIYSLFSVILSQRFILEENFNDFNTALKLNDLSIKSEWKIQEKYTSIPYLAITFENRIFMRLYEK